MPPPPDLPLADRSGLPDEIAYLRAAYPQAGWRTHANFGQLSAFWLHVHEGLRAEGGGVTALARSLAEGQAPAELFPRTFVPRFNHFLQHLHAHHTIEDTAYFPKFRALDPRMAAGFELLEADHGVIDGALHQAVGSARQLLPSLAPGGDADTRRRTADAHAADTERLTHLLRRHLADEEELVIPAMLEHGERAVG